MFGKHALALAVCTTIGSAASLAFADATYSSAVQFQPISGANEAVISRGGINTYITNTSASDIIVVAAPSRSLPVPAGNQTVVIRGSNDPGVTGTCSVRSVAQTGLVTHSISLAQTPGTGWTLNFPFTGAQAPANNSYLVQCSLTKNSGNRLYTVNVTP